MAGEATNGQTVTTEDAADALKKKTEYQHTALEHYSQFYHHLTGVRHSLYALADEDAYEYDEQLLSFMWNNNASAWDNCLNEVETLIDLLKTYVAEEYPDEVVWTANPDARSEIDA